MATLDDVCRALGLPLEELKHWLQLDPAAVVDALTSITADDPAETFVPIAQAIKELEVSARLVRLVVEKERSLRGRTLDDKVINLGNGVARDNAPETIRALHELRTGAFGKVVELRDTVTGEPRTLRVAQANIGFPAEVGVLNRLAPVAQQLASAGLGDEITTPKGTYEVLAVAYLEGFTPGPSTDFERMDLLDTRIRGISTLERLRSAVETRRDELRRAILEGRRVVPVGEVEAPAVRRTDAERLSTRFYTRTTKLQEELMQRPSRGLLVVHGVAGSGKTSIALGRTKMLCDRALGRDR
jgi:predicted ribonuclease YlaK